MQRVGLVNLTIFAPGFNLYSNTLSLILYDTI